MPTIATAGHVDHGKSTLVRALTGTEPDRLAEERRRGLTIDLGFASMSLPSGRVLGFVDVPGHERYLPNMLAGAGAVRACLLVVSAAEGWRAQTEEHLRVLELLGVDRGVVAVSKADTVDAEALVLRVLEVTDHLRGSPLEAAAVLPCDAVTGSGLDNLVSALDHLLDRLGPAPGIDRPRLWVDRSFAIDGAGTVVTGTLAMGELSTGDEVEVVGASRALQNRTFRVRGLQHHHGAVERIGAGERVAVNLAGVSHRDIPRGAAVVAPGRWFTTMTFDASLRVLESLGHDVSRRGAFSLHMGSAELSVRLRVLGTDRLGPGEAGLVRVHLPRDVPLVPGDRYVLREAGRSETVGGGEVLDVDPVLPASVARPDRSVQRVVAEHGRITAEDLELRTGVWVEPQFGRWVVDPKLVAETRERIRSMVRTAGSQGLELRSLDDLEREVALRDDDLTANGSYLRSASATVRGATGAADPGAELAEHPWVVTLREDPLAGIQPDGVDPVQVRALRSAGLVVNLDGVWFATSNLEELVEKLAELLRSQPEGVTIAAVREKLGGTRRTLVPFLSWCDRQGLTRRRGDVRVAGARLFNRSPS